MNPPLDNAQNTLDNAQNTLDNALIPDSLIPDLTTPPPPPPAGGNGAGDFGKWFEAYPVQRRKDRLQAERQWVRMARGGRLPPLREMLGVLARQVKSEEWGREEGRYVPLPHRYLRLGRFVDASVSAAREPPGACKACQGSGYRQARPGEEGTGGQVRCECKGARGP